MSKRNAEGDEVDIVHHGAVDGVTGSCHQLFWAPGRSLLVDCGLFQGSEDAGGAANQTINFSLRGIDALIVTHVHIDHVGRLPALLAAGFSGPIYCTYPSSLLLPVVLEDAMKIGVTRNRGLVNRTLAQLRRQIVALPYLHWVTVASSGGASVRIKLHNAGHILGAAYVSCQLRGTGWPAGGHTVVFSGDLGAPHSPLLAAPRPPYGCHTLVLESTYGDRLHEGRRQRRARLAAVLKRAIADNGAVVIPAFSIGRTQELLYEIESLLHRGQLPAVDIVVDSPLAAKFTALYRKLKVYWDAEAKAVLHAGRHPLAFEQLLTVDSHGDHLAMVEYLPKRKRPTVVLAASGMCSGGRVVNYLKALIGEPRTDIVFVGYQARGTPGRAIIQYAASHGWVELDGERYTINAAVTVMAGYSAHADQRDLIHFATRMRKPPKLIKLIHGDEGAKQALQGKLQAALPACRVVVAR